MFCFRCRRASLFLGTPINYSTKFPNHCFLQILLPRSFSTSTDSSSQVRSLTISYLTDSCGLSPAAALSAAQKLRLRSIEHADSMLSLLKSYGFSNTHIAKFVEKNPLLLSATLDVLRPKLEFFRGVGFSGTDIGNFFSSEAKLLATSLANRIIPNFNLLEVMLGGKEGTLSAIRHNPRLLMVNINNNFVPNIETLRRHGMTKHSIVKLMNLKMRALLIGPNSFNEYIGQLGEMGYDFSTEAPVRALSSLIALSRSTWERKLALYKSLGLSKEEILAAFIRNPSFVEVSDEKVRQRADFFMNKLKWSPAAIAARPIVLMLDLEKRVIPRYSVFNLLLSKQILKKKLPETLYSLSKKKFFEIYVKKYQEVPGILDAYEGRIEFLDFEMECNREPNLVTLKCYGVPKSIIRKLAKQQPKALLANSVHFKKVLQGLQDMGYDFSSSPFVDALSILATMAAATSESKFALYRSLGWSNDDIVAALKIQPSYVTVPDEQIRKIVIFFESKLNWSPTDIAACPSLLLLSIENCIVPRFSVFQMLVSKGLIKKKIPKSLFLMNEEAFLKKYVRKHQQEVPEILEIYKSCTRIVGSDMKQEELLVFCS